MNKMNYPRKLHKVSWKATWIMKHLLNNSESLERFIIYEKANWKEFKKIIFLCHLIKKSCIHLIPPLSLSLIKFSLFLFIYLLPFLYIFGNENYFSGNWKRI